MIIVKSGLAQFYKTFHQLQLFPLKLTVCLDSLDSTVCEFFFGYIFFSHLISMQVLQMNFIYRFKFSNYWN